MNTPNWGTTATTPPATIDTMRAKLASALLIATLALTGCSMKMPTKPAEAKPTATTAAAAPTPAQEAPGAAIPDVTGMNGAEARDALKAAGFKPKFDAGDDFVAKASNWTVTAYNPTGEAAAGSTITLTVTKPAKEPTPATDPTALDEINAAQFLGDSWEARFPYGGNVHWILDRITTPNADGTWTFKIGATLKDEYGNKFPATIEGDVGGTNTAPTINDSILYTNTGEIVNYYG